ncbi:Phage tail tube protein, GTA-gp10 [Cognatiyoonia koreensis]|uniref:Phage tail tube protein, GTA-gp10 n=1 Tax=Cognatiyoonia koreensis TaxID=364200 RepID=A0A1I0NSB7_9RHOB|nr:gene transfer agent family protein [Cognatiyoonia koreensis]SEW04423.1 Phage tail tube protein, GTA-gp10 [Cognatiyoonia koreensis]
MVNPLAGEVSVFIDGNAHVCKLTLGALAELESQLEERSMVDLVKRFESGNYAGRDVMALIVAGLRGGGWQGSTADLLTADIAGGPIGAAQIAATLLARAFTPPA